MNIAIITGASSGLGKVYAIEILKKYKMLDEIWIIARRKDRLVKLKEEYSNKIRPIPLDLTKPKSYEDLNKLLKKENTNIKILVTNAGTIKTGDFITSNLEEQINMVDVNVKSYLGVIRVCLPYMKKNSFIIAISSVSAFAPCAKMAVYTSTKTFVSFFCRSIREELKPYKINVLTVYPGNMDTEMNNKKTSKKQGGIISLLPYLNMNKLVKKSLKKAEKGKSFYTPMFFYKCYQVLSKITPFNLLVSFTKV